MNVEPLSILGLLAAGVLSGLVGYLTGLASIISYPALLAVGLGPVAANVSNTLGLVGIGAGATISRGQMLFGGQQRAGTLTRILLAAVGGGIGAILLLVGGDASFERIVPFLIIAASVAMVLSPRISARHQQLQHPAAYWIGLAAVCIYCGYFGGGAGTMYLALSLLTSTEGFRTAMVLKSVLLGVANLIAAAVFISFGPVDWIAAITLGIGCLIGGRLGPPAQDRIPEGVLRWTVACSGLALACWLWLR